MGDDACSFHFEGGDEPICSCDSDPCECGIENPEYCESCQ